MKTRWAIAMIVLLAGLAAVMYQQGAGSAGADSAAPGVRSTGSPGSEPVRRTRSAPLAAHTPAEPRPELDHQALAPSFEGTEIDGYLAADDNGNLILGIGVRDFFDYFLSAAGEAPLDEILAFMEAHARARLPQKAADQLMALLDQYMAFKRDAETLMKKPLIPASQQTREYYLQTLQDTFDELAGLRRQHMSPEAVTALFGLEEEYGRYTLDRMYIELDPGLDVAARDALIAELRAELPAPLRASEQGQVAHAERSRAIQDIIGSSASVADKRAALAELAGLHDADMVERIMSHVERKQAFQARVDRYLADKAELMAASLDHDALERRIDELRRRHFPGQRDQLLARSYEARQR